MKLFKTTVCRGTLYGPKDFRYKFKKENALVEGRVSMCDRGFHAANRDKMYLWPGTEMWQVELMYHVQFFAADKPSVMGPVTDGKGKFVGSHMTFLRQDRRWTKTKLLRYARKVMELSTQTRYRCNSYINDIQRCLTELHKKRTYEWYRSLCRAVSELLRWDALSRYFRRRCKAEFECLLRS